MFSIKSMEVVLFISLWFLFFSGPASSYGYIDYKIDSNNTTVTLSVPLGFEDNNLSQWRSIGYFLVNSHYKTYVLNWQGSGGYTSHGKEFIRYIQQAERQGKRITMNLTGNSYSMHAIVVCYATNIINKNNQFLMFHADGYGRYRAKQKGSSVNNQLNTCVYNHTMTRQELDRMWAGYEVYINNTQTWYRKDTRTVI